MTKVRAKSIDIREFIVKKIEQHPADISVVTANNFCISRQAVHKHLHKLVSEKVLIESGQTRNKIYKLALNEWQKTYKAEGDLEEDLIWRNDIKSVLGDIPENVLAIWQHGFTEMFNNAIDHSEGSLITVQIKKTALNTEMAIFDNGMGIFKKIQKNLNLLDERHALLELSKGKLTTDPKRHSGEGIFFTSRMFEAYDILSGGVYFSHQLDRKEDWIVEREKIIKGTLVWMQLPNHTTRTVKKIFDQYTGEDYGFNKTVVPVKLAQYGNDKLISRSQAKRLLARIEQFKIVIFDFNNVDSIGQAFADEIFRVFKLQHPEIELVTINTTTEIKRMIGHVSHF